MVCTFFGHRDTPDAMREKVKAAILGLLREEQDVEFYVGNNGSFDFVVQDVLSELKRRGFYLRYKIVLSFLGEKALGGEQEATFFPEGLENSLPKFAISRRNEWLIKNANAAIVYFDFQASNSYKWIEKARKRGIKILYL